ncbi:hypothetical protein BGZ95_007527 [Linnemannia exigua]|uniref:Uncharacterized protein n=1 Tax=Linnemannia exigua TaxID=604196 RepID=A0AAD4H8Y7_9FUNG|nr:hypothetical protein BGZ95_007527 [Linnemannia exigua]
MVQTTTARTAAQAQDQARYLATLYPPWCLLHLLLQHHKPLVSTLLLEELLDNPFVSTSSSYSTTATSTSTTANPSPSHFPAALRSESMSEPGLSLQRPRAKLSRHLIQRLHFGYYGNRRLLSESAVRYLTARARLEYGYFPIRGRAFWYVSQEDIDNNNHQAQQQEEEGKSDKGGRDKKSSGSSALRQPPQQQQQQPGEGTGTEDTDPTANKDDDLFMLTNPESSTSLGRQQGGGGVGRGTNNDGKTEQLNKQEQQQKMAKAQRKCEEREEILLLMEATRFCERNLPDNTTTESLSPGSPYFGQLETGIYWRQVAFTKWIDSVEGLSNKELAKIPPSPFLCRRADSAWMEHMEQLPSTSTPILLPSQKSRNRVLQDLHSTQDDARFFQIATGIFDSLATHPKKLRRPARPLIDGPFKLSLEVLRSLIFDYGYLPLPEDYNQRKLHYSGGDRMPAGDDEKFPSDGSHVVNKRGLKGEGTSIWYFYDLQRIEIMVVYLMHRAPDVLTWMFENGLELEPSLGPGIQTFSRTLLLQCCLPGCHAMVRHVYRTSAQSMAFTNPLNIINRVNEELLGLGNKPRRVEFQRQDFVNALKGVPAAHLSDSLAILTGVGMDTTVVQDRLLELLQIPGGPSSLDVEKSVLSILYKQASKPSPPGLNNDPLLAMLDIQLEPSETSQGEGYINPQVLQRVSGADIVNKAIRETFAVQMDMSKVRDREWKTAFEEILIEFETGSWRVHPNVSEWVLDNLDWSQPAFSICFDHALMEALAGILEWNEAQVVRLRDWVQHEENEAEMKYIPTGSRWAEVKKQLLTVPGDLLGDGRDLMEDIQYESRSDLGQMPENWIGLNIEWTTNEEVDQTTSEIVASMPQGSELIRMGQDGHLMLDNGCLDQGLLFCDPLSGEFPALNTNGNVHEFLMKDAVVEEKHLIWLALGLVTESFQGERVVEVLQYGQTEAATIPSGRSVLAKMVCSPEAYQLVWMVVVAYLRQTATLADERSSTPVAAAMAAAKSESTNSLWSWIAADDLEVRQEVQQEVQQEEYSRDNSHERTPTPTISQGSFSSWVSNVRTLKLLLTDRLGLDAWLMIEMLSEIEDDLEDAVAAGDLDVGEHTHGHYHEQDDL